MKKLFVLLFGLCLIGCTRANYDPKAEAEKVEEEPIQEEEEGVETTTVCTGDGSVIKFYAKGDKILSQEIQTTTDLGEELSYESDLDELLNRINEELTNTYGNVKGVEFQAYWEINTLQTIIKVDFEKADPQELYNAKLLSKLDKDAKYISLESSLADIQESGYACSAAE